MGHCKCRQCGWVVSVKAWVATKNGACPHCGHPHFSISFPSAGPLGQVATVKAGPADAYGRTRKIIRLGDLMAGANGATPKLSFKERMHAYTRPERAQDPHGEET